MLELPEPTGNPLAQQRQLLEVMYAQLAVLTEIRDALRVPDAPPDRPETVTGARARK
jgi:hypothetical protein